MGWLKSICSVCGEEYPNDKMFHCGSSEYNLKEGSRGCGEALCRNCYVPFKFIKRGIFKDKHVVHYSCPQCGCDNGPLLKEASLFMKMALRSSSKPTSRNLGWFDKDGGWHS